MEDPAEDIAPKFPHVEPKPRLSVVDGRPTSILEPETLEQGGKHNDTENTRPTKWNTHIFHSPYLSLFKSLRSYQDKALLCFGILLAVAAGAPLPVIGLLFSQIIDTFPPSEDELRNKLCELIGAACIYFVLTWGWCVCWGLVGERISRDRREAIVKNVLALDMSTHDTAAPDVAALLMADCQTIQLGTSEKVGLFIQSISYFAATIIVGFILNATLTGILLAAVVPSITIVLLLGTRLTSKWAKKASVLAEAAGNVLENAIGSAKVVQAYGIPTTFLDQHQTIMKEHVSAGTKKSIASACMLGMIFLICYSTNALAFFEGNRLDAGSGAGKVYAITFLLLDATFVIGQVGPFISSLTLAGAAAGRVSRIIKLSSTIDSSSESEVCIEKKHFEGDINIRNVSFVYPARPDARVLDNINMKFPAGAFSAIVGLSGSGKSTIASLLLRLYDPMCGSIDIGGVDLKIANVRSLRSHIAFVDQDSFLFQGTILQNMACGILNSEALTEESLHSRCLLALKDANCDFVDYLPAGIHTMIGGDNGIELSGGQRQRLSLARALVRQPSLLVLDEPSSALDSRSEMLMMEAIQRASTSGITVVMIAHRLSTVSTADNIIVMEHGKVAEQGKHDELSEREGLYTTLLRLQQTESYERRDSERTLVASEPDEKGICRVSSDIADEILLRRGVSEDALQKLDRIEVAGHEIRTPNTSSGNSSCLDLDANSASPASAMGKLIDVDIESAPSIAASEVQSPPKRSVLELLRRVWHLTHHDRLFIALGVIASIISGALVIGEAFMFGHLIAALNAESPDTNTIHLYCLLFFILGLVALLAYSTSGSSFGFVSERLVMRTQNMLLANMLDQDQAFFSSRNVHELIATIKADCGAITGLSGVILGSLCSIVTSMLGGIILAHVVAWKIAIVLLATVPIIMFAYYLRLHTAAKFEQRHKSAYTEAAGLATEACKGIRTVATYGLESSILEKYKNAVGGPYKESKKHILLGNLILAMSYSITYFVYALAYWWGATQLRNGTYTQLQFFIVLPALLFSAQSSGRLFSMSPELTRARVAASSVFDLLDSEPTIIKTRSKSMPEANITTGDIAEKSFSPQPLTMRNISLTYPTSTRPVLSNLTLTFPPSTFTALVGPSGAGKSSMISLLERFYDPQDGCILHGTTDIKSLPAASWRAKLALIPQQPDLFSGSIAFNIGLGAKPGTVASQDDIEAVCKAVGIHAFITSLPNGYNTPCGSSGSHLSGGQKQRIAIARALLRDPEILLLDECTASLDAQSEREVLEAITQAGKGRTVIMVTHRLGSVVDADNIVVLDAGRVVEQGRHEELGAKGGLYALMAREQALES